jgi:hypothetical protein
VFTLVPGGADAEHGAPIREGIEGGDNLRQQSGVPVGDTGDEESELDSFGLPGEEAECGVSLEHRGFAAAELFHLEVVVHQSEPRRSGLVGGLRRVRQCRGQLRRPAGQREVHEVDA